MIYLEEGTYSQMRQPNEMETLAGPIVIPGWDEMVTYHRTRAIVFQSLTNLVLEHYIPPTKKELLKAVIEQQKASDIPPLSNKSLKAIQDHLDNLVETGYVFRLGLWPDSRHTKVNRAAERWGAAAQPGASGRPVSP